MLSFAKRYWGPILGGIGVLGFLAAGVGYTGGSTVGSLVETSMRSKGDRFVELLTSRPGISEAFLTGIARDPDQETDIRRVASLAGIDSFAVFDRAGNETFSTRSDRYEWLLRDRPGGIVSGDRLAENVVSRTGDFRVIDDIYGHSPSVIAPLIRDGRTIGFVSVVSELTQTRDEYLRTLADASLQLLLVLVLATGIPALVYVRRHRKIAEADERIQFLANYDPLTRLFNRKRIQEETERVLASARATREEMAYLMIDIERLAEVNDALGQQYGDILLRTVADRLVATVDRNDFVARIAADDFAVLHRGVGGPAELAGLVRKLRQAVSEPVELGGKTIRPRISIGSACMPRDGRTHAELVKHAELALIHHKTVKTGDFASFEPFMDEATHRRREVEAQVRASLEAMDFQLFYQPIVSGNGRTLLGFEALLRMPDGKGGYVSPAVFVPIAEAGGYIRDIGTWVIQEATRQIALWPEPLFVAVNLSAVQFQDGNLVTIVEKALKSAGIAGSRLEIEVVESLVLERSDGILSQLRALKSLGISIDMDDFGTGYSSLGYLWRFPFDKLKIDQSFMVAFEAGEPNVGDIVGTIIALAHQMRMKVTAEGIESQAQADLLQKLGCDQLQGYLFGKPIPADRVAGDILSRFLRREAPVDLAALDREDEAGAA